MGMMRFGQIDCKEIIVRLADDFWAKQKGELTKKVGEISQDFIDRRQYNSTERVKQLVCIHHDYIDKLLDSLIESLESNYEHLSPIKCKPRLLKIVEREFANLARKVPGWLNESQLLNRDQVTLRSFEGNIQKKKEEAKIQLENRCSLWEQRWKVKKRRKRIKSIKAFLKWFVGPGLGVVIIVWFCRGYLPYKEQSTEINTVAQGSLPSSVLIDQLIEDYEAWLDKYFVEFERQYEKVVDDFVEDKSHQSPLDSGLFENAELEIENRFIKLTRGIQDLLLEEYGSTEFNRIKDVSNEFLRYQEAVEKTKQLKDEITKMEDDPARITTIFDKLNRKK